MGLFKDDGQGGDDDDVDGEDDRDDDHDDHDGEHCRGWLRQHSQQY